jgi:hypothetical protein
MRPKKQKADIVQILKDEYGIRTMAELDAAIAKIQAIDISPFCGVIETDTKEKEDKTIG